MSCQEYFERIRNIVEVIRSLGGSLCDDMQIDDELPPTNAPTSGYTPQQYRDARERIQNKTLAYGILVHANRSRYGKLIEEVENAFLKGNNDYPKTPTEAYNLLVNYRQYNNPNKRSIPGGLDQVAFVKDGKHVKTVYYHPATSANILSFNHIALRFKSVTYDNRKKSSFVVQRDDGSYIEFILSKMAYIIMIIHLV